jgi:hypothetical protein
VNSDNNNSDDETFDNIEIITDRRNRVNDEIINKNDLIKVHDINFTFSNTYKFKKSSNKINFKISTDYNVKEKQIIIHPEMHIDYVFRNNLKSKTKIIPSKDKIGINLTNFEYIRYSDKNYASWLLLSIFPHPYIKSSFNLKKRRLGITFGNKWSTDYVSLVTHYDIISSKFGIIGTLPLHDVYSSKISIHTDIFKSYNLKYTGKIAKGMNLEVIYTDLALSKEFK